MKLAEDRIEEMDVEEYNELCAEAEEIMENALQNWKDGEDIQAANQLIKAADYIADRPAFYVGNSMARIVGQLVITSRKITSGPEGEKERKHVQDFIEDAKITFESAQKELRRVLKREEAENGEQAA